MRKLLMLCSVFMLLSLSMLGVVNASESIKEIISQDKEYYERNWARVETASEIEKKIKEYYQINDSFEEKYPAYFGGLYVSDDAKNLIIQIVKKNIPNQGTKEYEFFNNIITLDDSIEIEFVNYSFNDLIKANNSVVTLLEDTSLDNDLTGTYIDVMNNTAVIELKDNNMVEQEKIRSQIRKANSVNRLSLTNGASIYTFQKGEEVIKYAKTNLNVGANIGDVGCSMAFRTRYKGYDGYVTAGHCFTKALFAKSGKAQLIQYNDKESGDYAFVSIYSDYHATNILEYPEINIMSLSTKRLNASITVNMGIAKVGAATGYTSGKVTGLRQSIKYDDDGFTINDLFKSNLKSDKGDSGGAVFVPKTDTEGGSTLIGIDNSGSKGVLGLGRSMYFTSVSDILSELNRERY